MLANIDIVEVTFVIYKPAFNKGGNVLKVQQITNGLNRASKASQKFKLRKKFCQKKACQKKKKIAKKARKNYYCFYDCMYEYMSILSNTPTKQIIIIISKLTLYASGGSVTQDTTTAVITVSKKRMNAKYI